MGAVRDRKRPVTNRSVNIDSGVRTTSERRARPVGPPAPGGSTDGQARRPSGTSYVASPGLAATLTDLFPGRSDGALG
jgi:hypothetical protein